MDWTIPEVILDIPNEVDVKEHESSGTSAYSRQVRHFIRRPKVDQCVVSIVFDDAGDTGWLKTGEEILCGVISEMRHFNKIQLKIIRSSTFNRMGDLVYAGPIKVRAFKNFEIFNKKNQEKDELERKYIIEALI